MSPPRVLQIGKHFYPDRGGIETVTKNVSDALAMTGIVADVLCMALHSAGNRTENGYQVFRSPANAVVGGNKTLSWDYARQIGRLSPQYDVGILHVPNPLGAVAAMMSWKKPLILLWHADVSHRLLEVLIRPIDIAIARRADAIIAPTQVHLTCSNRAFHLLPKSEVIPFPLAPLPALGEDTSPLVVDVERFARGRRIVFAAGRLVPYKGFDVLIQAMKVVDRDLCCVIAGDGPLREPLQQQIAAAGVADSVMLMGPVNDSDMAALVDLAWFGCLPSVTAQEMYGLTQIEMMSAGKPVVSTRLSGSGVPLVNRHDDTGLLAEPGNVADLARQLNALVADPALYRRLAGGAARAYEREYSLRTVGERYASLIRRLAAGDGRMRH